MPKRNLPKIGQTSLFPDTVPEITQPATDWLFTQWFKTSKAIGAAAKLCAFPSCTVYDVYLVHFWSGALEDQLWHCEEHTEWAERTVNWDILQRA